jgi:hypothetical protein
VASLLRESETYRMISSKGSGWTRDCRVCVFARSKSATDNSLSTYSIPGIYFLYLKLDSGAILEIPSSSLIVDFSSSGSLLFA